MKGGVDGYRSAIFFFFFSYYYFFLIRTIPVLWNMSEPWLFSVGYKKTFINFHPTYLSTNIIVSKWKG